MARSCRHCGATLDEETFFLNEGEMLAEIQAIQEEAKAKESKHLALKKKAKLNFIAAPILVTVGLGLLLASGQKALEILGGVLCGGGVILTFIALRAVKQIEAADG